VVFEIVTWPRAKTHLLNQDWPHKTLCGVLLPSYAEKLEDSDEFPECLRCGNAAMKS